MTPLLELDGTGRPALATVRWTATLQDPDGRWWHAYTDGTRLPAIHGAEGDDDDGGDGGDGGADDDDEDDDEDGGEDDDYTPPSREEWEKTQAKLKRVNSESARRRKWLDEHGIDPRTGKARKDDADDEHGDDGPAPKKAAAKKKADGKDDDGQDDSGGGFTEEQVSARVKRAVDRATARTELRYKLPLARSAAEAALARANFNGRSLDRVMKLIDLDEIDIDSDGEVIGLEEQVDQIKEDFPEWFSTRRRRRTADTGGGNGGGGGGRASTKDVGAADKKPAKDDKPKTWKETLAERMGNS
ncbi:hypothetical protein [Actinomadura nitritigenes]|uniref:phage scaffolding protein n=1 Tax=Actinomadura nitritigenes TaxID=134602 RepID=UPI003D8C7A95